MLDRAERAVAEDEELCTHRIGFVRLGLEYTRAFAEVKQLMLRLRDSDGQDKAAEDKAREIWGKRIWPLATNKKYPWAVNAFFAHPGHGRSITGSDR